MPGRRSTVHVTARMLRPGDVVNVGNGVQHITSVHQPGSDWNPCRTIVRVLLTGVGWLSLPQNRRVELVTR